MFENLSIGIKTFLRDSQLFHTVDSIRRNLPGVQMIIADCGDPSEEKDGIFADLEREGHKTFQLDFDSGFGAMSNKIADNLDRDFLLVGSDDFDFSTLEALHGIEKLADFMSSFPSADIVSGRVNNNPYEFYLIEKQPGEWYEEPLTGSTRYFSGIKCDLTVNYFLTHKGVLKKVKWDNDVKIGGGEHASFFIDCKKVGFETFLVPDVNINEQQVRNSPRYNLYRRRAQDPARPCFVKRGIKKYVCGNGVIDYDETQGGANAVR